MCLIPLLYSHNIYKTPILNRYFPRRRQSCKSQYNNVGLGQNNIVVFPTFLFCPNRFQ